ncbi:hypothetical protein UPYG_G00129890 [Umbra pygmaea]|uniref:Uncharacterized protein n=1 Tax=Umbra pygmaea TaxID=75934 RepID=A0ABD0X6S9_UMBPY
MEDTDCYVGLALLSLALLISICVNVILFFLRHKERKHRAVTEELLYPLHYAQQSAIISDEEEEHHLNLHHHLQQENPIYGNITSMSEVNCEAMCYEAMNLRRSRENKKPHQAVSQIQQPDINYASLDLDVGQKHRKKKRRYQQNQNQLAGGFLEVDMEVEASLPSRSSSPLASRNSIYLNSQQMALETDEKDRKWETARERGWERDMDWETGGEERGRDRGMRMEGEDDMTQNLDFGPSDI